LRLISAKIGYMFSVYLCVTILVMMELCNLSSAIFHKAKGSEIAFTVEKEQIRNPNLQQLK